MNVGNFSGAGTARHSQGHDDATHVRAVTRAEMARDAALALIAARCDLVRMQPPPQAETAAPSRRKP